MLWHASSPHQQFVASGPLQGQQLPACVHVTTAENSGVSTRVSRAFNIPHLYCVTSVTVGDIIKLRCFEEVNVLDTSISEGTYIKFLNRLSHFTVRKSLHVGYIQIRTSDINLLLATFRNSEN
jgi:hypothetical protein